MITAFITGLAAAGFGILLSLLIKNWQVSFIISLVCSIISVVISTLIYNLSVLLPKKRAKGDSAAIEDAEKMAQAFGAFGSPNIVVTVILYFVLYR